MKKSWGNHMQSVKFVGILNVTPDSFSDGGSFCRSSDAIEQGMRLIEEGADVIDIGGDSTRPGSECVGKGEEWKRIEEGRWGGRFESLKDLAFRTSIGEATMTRLAEAGALEGLKPRRRQALWEVKGIEAPGQPRLTLPDAEPDPAFASLTTFEEITWDYRATGNSTRGHPLAPLREALRKQGLPDAESIRSMNDGDFVKYAGMVICRQRPGTAKGVVFMTLEDETGFVNLVIWQAVFQKFMVLAKTASFIGVTGKLQVASQVTHLVADALWKPKLHREPLSQRSRDFH